MEAALSQSHGPTLKRGGNNGDGNMLEVLSARYGKRLAWQKAAAP
jgi:hypothetical protein